MSISTETRRRWPRVAAAIGVLLALVAGVSIYFASKPGPVATPPPAAPQVNGAATVLADGCLGGTDPVKAIRVARAEAPLTPEGAAEFVATYARWRGQAPHDPVEFQETGKLMWAPTLPTKERQTPPAAPPGAAAWVSTEDARYRVVDVSGPDMTIEAYFPQTGVEDGAPFEMRNAGRFTVTAIDGHWAYKGTSAGDLPLESLVAELQAEGLPYKSGC